jgi:ABC-type sugar transport system ATPase subunit
MITTQPGGLNPITKEPRSMPIIEVKDLSKIYRTQKRLPGIGGAFKGLFNRQYTEVRAVDGVTFDIEEGELVGFLGPNGAGKTTTLKMLSGILYPTSGTARVMGFTPWERKNDYRRQFALVMGQKNQLWWDLPAQESLYLNKEIYGVTDKAYQEVRASSGKTPFGHHGPGTFVGRTHEVRIDRVPFTPSPGPFSGRADHRAGCGGPEEHPGIHQGL